MSLIADIDLDVQIAPIEEVTPSVRGVLKEIITDSAVWGGVTDDYAPPKRDYQPPTGPGICYLLVYVGETIGGCFLLVGHGVCYEVHTCLLKRAWGPPARRAATELLRWLWQNTDAERLNTKVPAFNRIAYRFAIDAGMEWYGRSPRSYKKWGKVHDVDLLGISRPAGE